MNVKVFCKPSSKVKHWDVYVTDMDDFETYVAEFSSKDPPSNELMEKFWNENRSVFKAYSKVS